MTHKIKYAFKQIEVSGYKSLQDVVIEDVTPLMVLAGSNGAGKSNFVDALRLLNELLIQNIEVFTQKLDNELNINFKICRTEEIEYSISVSENKIVDELLQKSKENIVFKTDNYNFGSDFASIISQMGRVNMDDIKIKQNNIELNKSEHILESNESDNNINSYKKKDTPNLTYTQNELYSKFIKNSKEFTKLKNMLNNLNNLKKFSLRHLYQQKIETDSELNNFISILSNVSVFRINPIEAKKISIDNTETLKSDGSNIASILANLEQDDEIRYNILDWLSLIVPEMKNIETKNRRINDEKTLEFTEESGKKFPAHMVSDGTIYALCILVAILTRTQKPGITIIEEPERGLHPQAIGELIGFMREHASINHPIILTTHSESVVRKLELEELFFVHKKNGKTYIKNVKDSGVDKRKIPLDTAWLTNLLNGGLPW